MDSKQGKCRTDTTGCSVHRKWGRNKRSTWKERQVMGTISEEILVTEDSCGCKQDDIKGAVYFFDWP